METDINIALGTSTKQLNNYLIHGIGENQQMNSEMIAFNLKNDKISYVLNTINFVRIM